jgi:hypothetical protein
MWASSTSFRECIQDLWFRSTKSRVISTSWWGRLEPIGICPQWTRRFPRRLLLCFRSQAPKRFICSKRYSLPRDRIPNWRRSARSVWSTISRKSLQSTQQTLVKEEINRRETWAHCHQNKLYLRTQEPLKVNLSKRISKQNQSDNK